MDTGKMQRLPEMNSEKSYELLETVRELGKTATNLCESLENIFLRTQLAEIIEYYYDIGKVGDIYEVFGGYVNRSFVFSVKKDGMTNFYFLRKHKRGTGEYEIQFEHSLINHCIANGLSIGAGTIENKKGTTYVKPASSGSFFAVYEFLEGEDKFTWDNPTLNDKQYASAAEAFAVLHNSSRNFDPKGLQRHEAEATVLVSTFASIFRKYAEKDISCKLHNYFLEHIDDIIKVTEKSRISERDLKQFPLIPGHYDFHPGNLKWDGDEVVGIFDFGWSKTDVRLFDVCMALIYCCTDWDDLNDGKFKIRQCALFLNKYQYKLKSLNGLQPISEIELKNLHTMLAIANIYLVKWEIAEFYSNPDSNVYEYLAYLKHSIRVMQWIEKHEDEINSMIKDVVR